MTNQAHVLAFLKSIAPREATNSEIVSRTGIRPHQQVFMLTRDLVQRGLIKGIQAGHEWRFWYGGPDRVDPAALPPRLPLTAPSTADVAYPWDTSDSLLFRVGMSWAKQGRVILADNRLMFPVVKQVPGLYRFRIRASAGEAIYIGESENLARRFRLYSGPGPSQQTNLRLNAKFRNVLSERAEIGVAIVTTEAWIDVSGTQVIADLSSKAMRRLF
jgi:hypothetical protein